MSKTDTLEIIGDCLLVAFGIILIYIFLTIEVFGQYGVENNALVRQVELFMGVPIIIIGIERFLRDARRR